jgi:hypothetical protein
MPKANHQATELERSEESSQTPAEPGASKSGGFSVHMLGPEKVDMLSELPDDVLCKMLRFLDIDSAVHCGMLSTRWPVLIDEKVTPLPPLSRMFSGSFLEASMSPCTTPREARSCEESQSRVSTFLPLFIVWLCSCFRCCASGCTSTRRRSR